MKKKCSGCGLGRMFAASVLAAAAAMVCADTDIYGNEIRYGEDGKVTYRFLVSGNPETQMYAKSSELASEADGLVSGTLSLASAGTAIEARYRTWFESDGIGLDSSELKLGMRLILR